MFRTENYSSDQIKKNHTVESYGTYEGEERAYRILVGKYEAKRAFRTPRPRWKGNNKVYV